VVDEQVPIILIAYVKPVPGREAGQCFEKYVYRKAEYFFYSKDKF
jgi:hypothetical protein